MRGEVVGEAESGTLVFKMSIKSISCVQLFKDVMSNKNIFFKKQPNIRDSKKFEFEFEITFVTGNKTKQKKTPQITVYLEMMRN